MSAFGTFPATRPQGLVNTVGRCPHPRSPRGRGAGKTPPAPLPRSVGSPPTCKGQAASGCFASLGEGFQLRLLRIVLLPPRRWEGVKGVAVHFTLDALESTTLTP